MESAVTLAQYPGQGEQNVGGGVRQRLPAWEIRLKHGSGAFRLTESLTSRGIAI